MNHRNDGLADAFNIEIGRLATLLHHRRTNLLVIESEAPLSSPLSNSTFWRTTDHQVQFESLEIRNECVALHTFRERVQSRDEISPSELFDIAYELWRHEIGHRDHASGRFLALAGERVNILAAAAKLISSGEKQVFDVLHLVEATLQHLPSINAEDLCSVIAAQHPKTEQDHARGMIFTAIEKTLAERPTLALDLYEQLKKDVSPATQNLATSALLGLARSGRVDDAAERVLRDAISDNTLLIQISLWTTARLLNELPLPEKTQKTCIETLRKCAQSPITSIRVSATQAIAHAAKSHPILYADLLSQAKSLEKEMLAVTANHLFLNSGSFDDIEKLSEFLDALTHVTSDLTGVLHNIDWVLSRLLSTDRGQALALRFLRTWITAHGSSSARDKESIEIFDQTFMELGQRPGLLQTVITEWLSADERQLPSACGALISFLWVRGNREPKFSKEVLDRMNSDDLILLVRRMLGFVFSEEPLLSLTFSLLNTESASDRTFGLVHSLLSQEIGRDYPQDTLEMIKKHSATASPEVKTVLDSAYDQIGNYMKAIDQLPRLQELRPLPQIRRAIALRRSAEMRRSMDEVNEQSIISKLAMKVQLKAGTGWFSVDKGNVGETHQLHSLSHSVALPRRYLSDPVGYEIQGLLFRNARKGEK